MTLDAPISFLTTALYQGVSGAVVVPGPQPAAEVARRMLAKRAVEATAAVDVLRYRTCPRVDDGDCPAVGKFSQGTRVTVECYTTENTNPSKAILKSSGGADWKMIIGQSWPTWIGQVKLMHVKPTI